MKLNFSMLSTLSSILLSLEDVFLVVGGRWSEDREPEAGLAGSTGTVSFLFLCSICPNRSRYSVQMSNVDIIIESVDSISRDEPDSPLTQYITNAGISRARYTTTLCKHHHRVLRLISNQISV